MKNIIIFILLTSGISCFSQDNGILVFDEHREFATKIYFNLDSIYEEIRADFKNSESAQYYTIATLFFSSNQFDSAIVYLEKAYQFDRENKMLLKDMGIAYTYTYNDELAKKYFIKSLKIDPCYNLATNSLTIIYRNQDSIDLAIKYYKGALKCNPDIGNGVLYQIIGEMYKMIGNMDSCCTYYKEYLKYYKEDQDVYMKYGCDFYLSEIKSPERTYLFQIKSNIDPIIMEYNNFLNNSIEILEKAISDSLSERDIEKYSTKMDNLSKQINLTIEKVTSIIIYKNNNDLKINCLELLITLKNNLEIDFPTIKRSLTGELKDKNNISIDSVILGIWTNLIKSDKLYESSILEYAKKYSIEIEKEKKDWEQIEKTYQLRKKSFEDKK